MWPTTCSVAAQNLITFGTDFGPERKNYYDGVDLSVNTRLRQGLTLQVGSTTGRSVVNTCDTGRFDGPTFAAAMTPIRFRPRFVAWRPLRCQTSMC